MTGGAVTVWQTRLAPHRGQLAVSAQAPDLAWMAERVPVLFSAAWATLTSALTWPVRAGTAPGPLLPGPVPPIEQARHAIEWLHQQALADTTRAVHEPPRADLRLTAVIAAEAHRHVAHVLEAVRAQKLRVLRVGSIPDNTLTKTVGAVHAAGRAWRLIVREWAGDLHPPSSRVGGFPHHAAAIIDTLHAITATADGAMASPVELIPDAAAARDLVDAVSHSTARLAGIASANATTLRQLHGNRRLLLRATPADEPVRCPDRRYFNLQASYSRAHHGAITAAARVDATSQTLRCALEQAATRQLAKAVTLPNTRLRAARSRGR